jgi:O-6-methylguanine DNA methyltransferase
MHTLFQKQVWDALVLIPRGRVTTYGEIARYLKTNAVRAVGSAVGKNPYAPDVPCHRVVPSNGMIGNYSAEGGIGKKISLLEKEGVTISANRVINFGELFWSFDRG